MYWRAGRLVVQLDVLQDVADGDWHLDRCANQIRALSWSEGVAAAVEHLLGEPLSGGLDAQVAEHGIRLPATKQLDVILVNAGTEQGGGSTRAKGASTEEHEGNPSERLEALGGETKSVGDDCRGDTIPALVVGVSVVVVADGGVGVSPS